MYTNKLLFIFVKMKSKQIMLNSRKAEILADNIFRRTLVSIFEDK